jgi:hypothetical protein
MIRKALTAALALLTAACAATPEFPAVAAPSADPERDRRAILAMAGEYQVQFRFDETVALQAGYKLHEPHLTTGHEFVEVLEDSPRRIVLQHVLVDASGHVTKHWRQDWEYEQAQYWVYAGDYAWEARRATPAQARGRWLQTVWQVDDSPRYAALGAWTHENGVSSWASDRTWRPLPRREHTTRSDYDVVDTWNRQTLTPGGWVHEQDSLKLDRKAAGGPRVLVRERGLNTYTRAQGYDFGPGREYWRKTRAHWSAVRAVWAGLLAQHPRVALREEVDETPHYMAVMAQANDLANKPLSEDQRRAAVRETLQPYLILDGR